MRHDESILTRLRDLTRAVVRIPRTIGSTAPIASIAAARRVVHMIMGRPPFAWFASVKRRLHEAIHGPASRPMPRAGDADPTGPGETSDRSGSSSHLVEARAGQADAANDGSVSSRATREAVSADDPAPPEAGKGRERRRVRRRSFPDPPAATWVMVAPGRFLRVEASATTPVAPGPDAAHVEGQADEMHAEVAGPERRPDEPAAGDRDRDRRVVPGDGDSAPLIET